MPKSALLLSLSVCVIFISSCVPGRQLDECETKRKSCESELSALKQSSQETEGKLKQAQEDIAKFQKENEGLRRDTSIIGTNYRNLTAKYDKLNVLNEQLLDRYNKLLLGSEKDNSKLSGDLQMTQEQLLKKQDELRQLEAQLNKQKADLETLAAELKKREARITELEDILKRKDQAAQDLKKKLSEALFNFEGKGLTITQKNGKIYVSMDESLLFASGKTNVEPKGVEALKNLAKVLEQNPEVNVMVEGHTDDVPMNGSGEIKDNWDLSVMRATSVTKIILKGGPNIDQKRITSAGRGEFFPLDPAKTAEARKKNRRTEIILTPKLDELLKVLESN